MAETKEWKRDLGIALRIALGISIAIAILYTLRVLPLPVVPIFNYETWGFAGFITCDRLEKTHWHFTYSSGEYFSPTPIYGVQYPAINMPLVSPYCPQFTPPPYE